MHPMNLITIFRPIEVLQYMIELGANPLVKNKLGNDLRDIILENKIENEVAKWFL